MAMSPGAGGHRKAGEIPPEMNVTPLVDVVLVLLIIFMVVAPRLNQDVQVDLPGIFNPDPDDKKDVDPLKVTVATKGEFHINERQYDLEGALALLETEHAADPTRRLVLRADQKLRYGDVREFLNRTQKLGFPGLSFMVGEKHHGAQPERSAGASTEPGQG